MQLQQEIRKLKEALSEYQRAKTVLRENEQKYRTIFEDSRDAVYITTRKGLSRQVIKKGRHSKGLSPILDHSAR